jgi:hypothetical protein
MLGSRHDASGREHAEQAAECRSPRSASRSMPMSMARVPCLEFVCDGKQVVQLEDQATVGCRVPVGDETTELRSEDTPLVGSEHRIQGSDFGVVLPEIGAEPVH